jgi:hypothetical protein
MIKKTVILALAILFGLGQVQQAECMVQEVGKSVFEQGMYVCCGVGFKAVIRLWEAVWSKIGEPERKRRAVEHAIFLGNLTELRQAVNAVGDINVQCCPGDETFLHQAVKNSFLMPEVIKLLVDMGADFSTCYATYTLRGVVDSKVNALKLACFNGHCPLVRIFCELPKNRYHVPQDLIDWCSDAGHFRDGVRPEIRTEVVQILNDNKRWWDDRAVKNGLSKFRKETESKNAFCDVQLCFTDDTSTL